MAVIKGSSNSDQLTSLVGDDTLWGGTGNDTAIFSGLRAGYEIGVSAAGAFTVKDIDVRDGDTGTDTLVGIQTLQFADGSYALDSAGTGLETLVNNYKVANQDGVAVSHFSDGSYILVWESSRPDSGHYGICGRRFSAGGVALTDEFLVNTTTDLNQTNPAVAVLADGGFVVTWENQGRFSKSITAQRYDAEGKAAGGEFQVGNTNEWTQEAPVVAALEGGGFVVAWQDMNSNAAFQIAGQRYDGSGAAVGGQFRINPLTDKAFEHHTETAIATLPGGGFVVAWSGPEADPWNGIYAQRFGSDGEALGSALHVNTTTAGAQGSAAIAAFADGGFVVAWRSENGPAIYAQRFDASGAAVGGEFQVSTYTSADSDKLSPGVATLADGGFVVAWASTYHQDGSYDGVYAQRFDSAGAAVGGEFLVNTWTGGNQTQPAVTALADGGYLIAWQSANADGDAYGVVSQRYDADGHALGGLHLEGSGEGDTLRLGAASRPALVDGLAGNDTLMAGSGQDTLQGGSGDDVYVVATATNSILENAGEGIDRIRTSTASFTLVSQVEELEYQGSAAFAGSGNSLANLLLGGAGDDTLDGGSGADTLAGGLGNDLYYVDDGLDVITESAAGGEDAVFASVSYSLAPQVENLTLAGAAIAATGNDLANCLTGNGNANTLDGQGGVDTLAGGGGDDRYLLGDGSTDVVVEAAGGGHDRVEADLPAYVLADDVEDLFYTGTGAFMGTGNGGDNRLSAGAGADTLAGGGGADTLEGGAGADSLVGGAGNDLYLVDNVGDRITEAAGEGVDQVRTILAAYTLGDQVEQLQFTGTGNFAGTGNGLDNRLQGSRGNDRLLGGGGHDTLLGGLGTDTLSGGAGNDVLMGGKGEDLAVYGGQRSGYEISVTSRGTFRVKDINLADGDDGSDELVGMNILKFADASYTLAPTGSGSEATLNTAVVVKRAQPDIAGLADGGFVAAWQDGYDVAAQRFDLVGNPLGYQVNLNQDQAVLFPSSNMYTGVSLAATARGGFLGAWESLDSISYSDVAYRPFGADGAPLADEGFAASSQWDTERFPEIITLRDGGSVVLWTSYFKDGDAGYGVFGRAYNAAGADSSGQFHVNANTVGDQWLPAAAPLGNGGFVVAWQSPGDGSEAGIYARLYSSAGSPLAGEFKINSYSSGNQEQPAVAALGDSGFVVTWASNGQDGGGFGVYGQRFNNAGQALGSEFQVNTYTAGDQKAAAVAGLEDGSFVVAWQSAGEDGSGAGIYARRYNPDGSAATGEFKVNGTIARDQVDPAVTALADGGFIISWQSATSDIAYAINAQRYDADGRALGGLGLSKRAFTGTSGNDSLRGSAGADTLLGAAGNDTLDGGAGADTMLGGSGNDTYLVDVSSDRIFETTTATSGVDAGGVDLVQSHVTWTLGNHLEKLTLMGTAAISGIGNGLANIITGNGAANGLNGGAGADTLSGGGGNDTYTVDNLGDRIVESSTGGLDLVKSSLSWTLGNYLENLTLTGQAASTGTGNGLNNVLIGNGAANALSGDAGADTLAGGGGADTLAGGAGNDIFDFNSPLETGIAATTRDVICDFVRGQDKIDLSTIDANALLAGNQAFQAAFIAASAGFTAPGQLKFTGGILYGNTDSDATAEFSIQITGVSSLAATDLLL